jgi:predicted ribosome quality control (RQC) complex YloA/Tae2 family protein
MTSWEAGRPLQRLLVRRFLAISPQLAREIAFRATGSTDVQVADAPPERVGEVVEELFAPLEDGSWTPHVALDEAGEVIAFAPYEPRQFSHVEPVSSISAGMYRYFSQVVSRDPYAAVRKRVEEHVESARRRIESGLARLESQLVDEEEIEALRQAGELLLTYQHRVERGASEVTLPDYEGEMRTIRLDPTRAPVENAQAYFRRYEKAQRANEQIPARRTALRVDRAYVAQLAADLELAESRPEIDEVRDALAEAGWVPKKRRRPFHKAAPLRFEFDALPVYVGRNARQNEEVTFSIAGADDLWLHTRDVPGAHVVIKCAKQEVAEEIVQQAARLAAYYSPARGAKNVPVVVVERRFVRRVGKGRPGLVTYRNERVLHVTAELGFRSETAGENDLDALQRP